MDDKLLQVTYRRWAVDPSENNTRDLLQGLNPTIDQALHTYAPGMEGKLKTKARLMALDTIKRYSPEEHKDTQINTFLFNSLHSIGREYKRRSEPLHVPEQVVIEKNKLKQLEIEFQAENGREPNTDELADLSGMQPRRIEKIRGRFSSAPESSYVSEQGDALFVKKGDPQKIWFEYIYHDLDPVDKKICDWSTGYGGADMLKKKDIAQRLGISAPAVSQRISKIIRKLEAGVNYG